MSRGQEWSKSREGDGNDGEGFGEGDGEERRKRIGVRVLLEEAATKVRSNSVKVLDEEERKKGGETKDLEDKANVHFLGALFPITKVMQRSRMEREEGRGQS